MKPDSKLMARAIASSMMEYLLACLVVLAFGVGLYLGGLVQHRKMADELALGRDCLESMEEVNRLGRRLADGVMEVRDAMLLEGTEMLAGYEPGVPGMFKGTGGP